MNSFTIIIDGVKYVFHIAKSPEGTAIATAFNEITIKELHNNKYKRQGD